LSSSFFLRQKNAIVRFWILDFGFWIVCPKTNVVFRFKNLLVLQTFDYKKESHASANVRRENISWQQQWTVENQMWLTRFSACGLSLLPISY